MRTSTPISILFFWISTAAVLPILSSAFTIPNPSTTSFISTTYTMPMTKSTHPRSSIRASTRTKRRSSRLYSSSSNADEEKSTGSSSSSPNTSPSNKNGEIQPDTHEELMYALGVNLARQLGDVRPLVENGDELAQVAKGLLDTVIGRLDDDGQTLLLAKRGKELNQLITDRANNIKEKLEQAGRDMLKQMEEKEGVIKLDSGVIVDVLEPAPEGAQRPTKASTVKVMYHGTLADGTIFDTTLGKDPVSFPLNAVVPGWRDGVLKMKEGDTAMIGIPPEQGYGPNGTPDGRIPGGSTLFFKVQLIEIMSAAIGGNPSLLGVDGKKLKKDDEGKSSSGLLGADGKPMM